ncbi:hypothetical protein JVU11DRAFT_5325 [Chiua virens]|nr:hypothetical protein JVU11DRAFT_5325 [Chiua virens]
MLPSTYPDPGPSSPRAKSILPGRLPRSSLPRHHLRVLPGPHITVSSTCANPPFSPVHNHVPTTSPSVVPQSTGRPPQPPSPHVLMYRVFNQRPSSINPFTSPMAVGLGHMASKSTTQSSFCPCEVEGAQCSASIDSGTVANKEIKYICRKWKMNKQKEWYGFYSELALYKSEQYLRPLQGDVVPHIIGVHILPEAASPNMPDALKEKVIAAFEKIHAQGVLHGDPELRHMLIGADGKVMIIDFGMSRANREHPSVGIERAEPEEFRLEMRKVKYKLDYMGARKKEGDKVDDYLRRVRRNRKASELWKRRARGERVGPIPQYEEDPEEYELDPPVNAQDFQEDWITASDDVPIRVIVPGQTSEEVANQVQALIWKLEEMCSLSSSPYPPGTEPQCSSQMPPPTPCPDHQERPINASLSFSLPRRPSGSHSTDESRPLCRTPTARRLIRCLPRQIALRNSPSRKCDDDLLPLSATHIEGTSMRRDYIRHKHLKNTYISSLSNDPSSAPTFPSSIDVPENPRSLKPEEYRKIQESRRQAMLQYSRAPKGILKRNRDEDEVVDPNDQVAAPVASPCKKLRFAEQVAQSSSRGRTTVL